MELLGLHGIAMAKTYLEVVPQAEILVVEKALSVGGSWAQERLYPRLKTNNVFGTYEFADFPLVPERYKVAGEGHIPGRVVHEYFSDVTTYYGIDRYLQLGTIVESATLQEDGRWTIVLQSVRPGQTSRTTVTAARLVLATGLTSEPNIPDFAGSKDFGGLILHSKQLKAEASRLSHCKRVVVVGGNKSAWDVCYDAAKSGAEVHMVIRPSGGGPSYLWPRQFAIGPFSLSLARLSGTRLSCLFDPTPFGPSSIWHYLIHRTRLGGKLCQMFWQYLDSCVKQCNGYDTHPELQKLKPWITPFWMGNSLSIHNYETNWFDLVREGKIHVHISDVSSLSQNTVHLSTGETVKADALVCCTGWKADPPLKFQPESVEASLGFGKGFEKSSLFEARAKTEVHETIIYLDTIQRRTPNAPRSNGSKDSGHRTSKFYRLSIPWRPEFLRQRNIAFIGAHSSIHAVTVAQAQALWITAFFQGKIKHLDPTSADYDEIRYEATFENVYTRMRRPHDLGGSGGKYADLVFDSIPYVDRLLRDVGLNHRRKGSWWKEWTECYKMGDYRGLAQEWMRVHGY